MDELESNPLYKAFLTKFRREYEIACHRSYMIAIPTSESLENITIDQFLANSHILLPSKLLRMHYTSLQAGCSEDIEHDGKKLVCYLDRKKPHEKFVANILAEEVGYNIYNKEFRTILIDRPLLPVNHRPIIRSLLSPTSSTSSVASHKFRPVNKLRDHDDCSEYLEFLSQELTTNFEMDLKRLQTNYMILSQYLDDAANRIRELTERYVSSYELLVRGKQGSTVCDSIHRAIRLAVETYAIHLLHGKLVASIYGKHERDDEMLTRKFAEIHNSRLTICQLGAQEAFSDFTPSAELNQELARLSGLQSPLAMVSCITRSVGLITECLSTSVRFKRMMGDDDDAMGSSTSVCSDDLIASFVYSLAQLRPKNLYSVAKYLDTFGWSATARDQAAYDAATFQIVVQYVFAYTNRDELTEANNAQVKANAEKVSTKRRGVDIKNGVEKVVVYQTNDGDEFVDSLDSFATTETGISPSSAVFRADWELL